MAQYEFAFSYTRSLTQAEENPGLELETMKVSGPAGMTFEVTQPATRHRAERARIAGRILMTGVLPHSERTGNEIPPFGNLLCVQDQRQSGGRPHGNPTD